MKVNKSDAEAMKCLGNKLEIVAADPDPNAMNELTEEYNCKNCVSIGFCQRLFIFVAK